MQVLNEDADILDALNVRKQFYEYVHALYMEGKEVSFKELENKIGISWRQLDRYYKAARSNESSPLPNEENRHRLQSFLEGKRYLSMPEQLDLIIRRLDSINRRLANVEIHLGIATV
jgi:hypothetical protein